MSQDWNSPPSPPSPPPGWGSPPPSPMGLPPGAGGVPGGNGEQDNTFAIVSLVSGGIGTVSMACCCIPFVSYFAVVLIGIGSITAIITGVLGLQESQRTGKRRNESIAGIVLGVVPLVVLVVMGVLALLGVAALGVAGATLPHQ